MRVEDPKLEREVVREIGEAECGGMASKADSQVAISWFSASKNATDE